MVAPERSLYVIQHTDSEFLGLMEDHLEGRGIRFAYLRPLTAGGRLPATIKFTDGVILLGGGPYGTAGERDLPSLAPEIELVRQCLANRTPVVGIGVGAQILSVAAGGGAMAAPFEVAVAEAKRVADDALNGYLPERFPIACAMRDRPVPPADARVLAIDEGGRPALFQIGANAFGFAGHPGAKAGMFEDLALEFPELEAEWPAALARLREVQTGVEDALVRIMTGLVQLAGWMRPKSGN